MLGLQLADIPRRLAVDQPFRPPGIEPHHPIPHRLQPDPADPSRPGPRAALGDLGQRQQPSALPRVAGRFGQCPKPGRVIVPTKLDPRRMANLLFATIESDTRRLENPE